MAMEEYDLGDFAIASLISWASPPTLDDLQSEEELKESLAVDTAELQAATEVWGIKDQNVAALREVKRLIQEELQEMHDRVLELEAMASSSSDSGWTPLLPPSPVAVEHPAMFAVPSPAAVVADDSRIADSAIEVPSFAALVSPRSVVADEGTSATAALQVPTFSSALVTDEGTSAATALEVPTFAALLSPTSIVADEGTSAAPALQVPTFAALVSSPTAAVVAEKGKSTAAALQVPTYAAALYEPSSSRSQYRSSHVMENRRAAVAAAAAKLDVVAGKRPLPQKGRLLQAVAEAGPLLQDLMLIGRLPRWRNPPPARAMTTAVLHLRPMREQI